MKKVIFSTLSLLLIVIAYVVYGLYPKEMLIQSTQSDADSIQEKHQKANTQSNLIQATNRSAKNSLLDLNIQETKPDKESIENEVMSPSLKQFIASGDPQKIMTHFANARKERAILIQEHMSTEGVDHAWEAQIEQYVELSYSIIPEAKGLILSSTDCRESICALEFIYADNAHDYKKMEPYMSNIGNVLGVDAWVHHDATPNSGVIYLAKEDIRLPQLESSI